jgi:hypothetical protein
VHFRLSFHHILGQNKNKTSILTANYRLGARIKNREQTWCRQSTLLRAKLNQQQIAQWTATWAPTGSQERCGSACDRFRLIYAVPHARCPFVNHILGAVIARCFSPRPFKSTQVGEFDTMNRSLGSFPHKDDHQPAANPFIAATASWYTHQRGT